MKMDLVKSTSRLKTPAIPACGSIEDPGLEDMKSGLVVKSIMERIKCDLAKVCDSRVNLAAPGEFGFKCDDQKLSNVFNKLSYSNSTFPGAHKCP